MPLKRLKMCGPGFFMLPWNPTKLLFGKTQNVEVF
jgi:hypothetical protein